MHHKITNFTQESNGQACTCGEHHGVDRWTPGRRAAVYARFRDALKPYFAPHMKAYLSSWEANHGPVTYEMRHAGFVKNTSDNKPHVLSDGASFKGPFCTSYRDHHDEMLTEQQDEPRKIWGRKKTAQRGEG